MAFECSKQLRRHYHISLLDIKVDRDRFFEVYATILTHYAQKVVEIARLPLGIALAPVLLCNLVPPVCELRLQHTTQFSAQLYRTVKDLDRALLSVFASIYQPCVRSKLLAKDFFQQALESTVRSSGNRQRSGLDVVAKLASSIETLSRQFWVQYPFPGGEGVFALSKEVKLQRGSSQTNSISNRISRHSHSSEDSSGAEISAPSVTSNRSESIWSSYGASQISTILEHLHRSGLGTLRCCQYLRDCHAIFTSRVLARKALLGSLPIELVLLTEQHLERGLGVPRAIDMPQQYLQPWPSLKIVSEIAFPPAVNLSPASHGSRFQEYGVFLFTGSSSSAKVQRHDRWLAWSRRRRTFLLFSYDLSKLQPLIESPAFVKARTEGSIEFVSLKDHGRFPKPRGVSFYGCIAIPVELTGEPARLHCTALQRRVKSFYA
jgi:hypothetical protein